MSASAAWASASLAVDVSGATRALLSSREYWLREA
jgi:hypothetical protein